MVPKEEIFQILSHTPMLLKAMLEDIPNDHFKSRKIREEWTIEEWVWHLIDAQTIFKDRFENILKFDNYLINTHRPDFKKPYPIPIEKALASALNDFNIIRKDQIHWLKSQTEEFWKKKINHEEYEPFDVPMLLRHMMFVDQVHLFNIEKLWLTKEEYL